MTARLDQESKPDASLDVANWDAGKEWSTVALLALAFGLVGLDRWLIAPLAPAMIADLGFTPQTINLLIAALGVTWGGAAVLMGGLSDRIGRRNTLVPALVGFSLLSAFSGAATGLATLLLARATMGVFEGAFAPASFAATAETSRPSRRGFNQGLQQSAFALFGLGFGPLIATQLLQVASWRVVFMLLAAPGLILAVLLWRALGGAAPAPLITSPAPERPPRARLGEVFAHRNVGLGMGLLLCAMCGVFVLSANVPIYLVQHLHLTPIQMGVVTSAIGFGGFCGQWGLPALSDRIGRRAAATIGFGLGAIFLQFFMIAGPNVPQLFVLLFITTGFSFGLLSLITGPIATEAAPPGRISATAGMIIGSGEIFGGGLALVAAGAIIRAFGLPAMLLLALGGLALGLILSLWLRETSPRVLARAPQADQEPQIAIRSTDHWFDPPAA